MPKIKKTVKSDNLEIIDESVLLKKHGEIHG